MLETISQTTAYGAAEDPMNCEYDSDQTREEDIEEELREMTNKARTMFCPMMIPFFTHIQRGEETEEDTILRGYSHDVNNNPIQAQRVGK